MPNKEAYEKLGVSRMTLLLRWTRDGVIEGREIRRVRFFASPDVERIKRERQTEE